MIDRHHGWNFSLKPLHIGLVISIILAFAAYRIVTHYHLTDTLLFYTLFSLATVQAIVQLVFFLHLGLESKPHWYLITFIFTVLIIVIVVGGTLWIMKNLSYNLMPTM